MIKTYGLLTRNSFQLIKIASCSTGSVKEKWDLLASVCLERNPIITRPLNEIEKEYKQYLADVEFEQSLKNDWELKQEQERKQAEQMKKGEDIDVPVVQTVQDFIDASADERAKFKVADRITEADKKNDLKSLNRKLDKHLVLLIEQKLGNKPQYLLPQGKREEGETLRQTAERVLKESCGLDIKAQFYGNAPAGFYKYKYPKSVQDNSGTIGAKVFFYIAKHKGGQVNKKDLKFKWLDRIELQNEIPPHYYKSVSMFLIDE